MTYTLYRSVAEQWVEWSTNNAPPPPPSQVVVPFIGWALDSEAQFSGMVGKVGTLLCRRSYNTPTTGVPASYSVSAAKNDRALGAAISYWSMKPSIADTASGALDAKLAAFARSCPAGTYVSWWPEGEAKRHGNNPAQFKAGLKRVYQVMKAANPEIFIGPCFMTYTLTAIAANPITQWYIEPLSDSADFVSWDGYNDGTGGSSWDTFAQVMAPALAWTRAHSDLPFVVGETGSTADPGNATRRAQWWTDAWAYAAAQQMPLLCGWQGSSFAKYDVYPGDGPALTAISNFNTISKAGRT